MIIVLRGFNEVCHDFLVADKVGFQTMLVVVVHDVYEKLFDVVRGIRRGLLFGAVRSWYGGG